MADNGTIKTGVSMPASLWNKVVDKMEEEGISNFSYWVQKSCRIHLQLLEKRKVKEFVGSLNDREYQLLINEIKKRG